MEEREKILRRVALKCADFARQLSYYRTLKDQVRGCNQNFWIYMLNNTIDLAVLDWFHLFGYHNDDLHWKRVVSDIDGFRQAFFIHMKMTEAEWIAYRELVKNYRDKDIAHYEIRPVSNVPEMQNALHATTFYYSIVMKELVEYQNYSRWPKELEEYYLRSLVQSGEFSKLAFNATKNISEKVY